MAMLSPVRGLRPSRAARRRVEKVPKARDIVERTGRRGAILSARHGLLWPEDVVALYDKKLAKDESGAWRDKILAALESHLKDVSSVAFLAGAVHRHHIAANLRERGIDVVVPMEGLTQANSPRG